MATKNKSTNNQYTNKLITNTQIYKSSKIVVFGATGLVGSAIVRKLIEKGYTNIIGTYHNRKPNTPITNNQSTNLYGNGKASEKIVKELLNYE